jgi:hypothetical protein
LTEETLPQPRARIIPDIYLLLAAWRYVEHSILRLIAGWGRLASAWEDKLAVCYHVWLQAQIVQAMRGRLGMFPGGKPEPGVRRLYQSLCDAVLTAPSWRQAMAGLHEVLNPAVVAAYDAYLRTAHPVHDRPTHELLREALESKRRQAIWYSSFAARHPEPIEARYAATIRQALADAGHLLVPVEPAEPFAIACGRHTSFRMQRTPGRLKEWESAPNIMPFLQIDWSHSVETRRLFFMIGYLWEMGVAEQQLRWLFYGDFMPWEFIHAEARHMWDESRHGDSGRARLADFGLDIADVGYTSYGASGQDALPPMTPRDLYEEFYRITQIAETGYFATKRYCFEDFALGRDDGSAEMMQFDIIDETSHVQYGQQWLTEMARRAGVTEDYRQRGARERAEAQDQSDRRVEALRTFASTGALPAGIDPSSDGFLGPHHSLRDERAAQHYHRLLRIVQQKTPLTNIAAAPIRPNLPM